MTASTVSLTDEQRIALTLDDVSIALSAGAGCGKTFVLTHRFLKPLQSTADNKLPPEQIDQLIAITFTERAAREMRERIRQRCRHELDTAVANNDTTAIDFWKRLNRYLDTAKISTIHSFCAQLLRSHAVDLGLDPLFRVIEQAETQTLQAETIEDTLRNLIAQNDDDTLQLLTRFSFAELLGTFATLLSQRDRAYYADWLTATPVKLLEAWQDFFIKHAGRIALRKVARHPTAVRALEIVLQDLSDSPAWKERQATIGTLLSECASLTENDFVAIESANLKLADLHQIARLDRAIKWYTEEGKEAFKTSAEKLRSQISTQQEILGRNWNNPDEELWQAADFSLRMLRVGAKLLQAYVARKQELAVLDFDDLLIQAHQLLTDKRHAATQRQIRKQVHLLLVDEFQDTDPLQVELVRSLCGDGFTNGKLFVVGDLKQSIYRFRGAQPRVFVQLQTEIPDKGRLPLSINFRSQPAILHFVNALFFNELTEEYKPLQAKRAQVAPEPAIEFLWAPADENAPIEENAAELRAREADWIARRLRNLIDSGQSLVHEKTPDGREQARPARWGDCALLFRRLTNVEEYEAALRRYDIPYYLVGGHAFYAQQEIFDVLNLLRAVAYPADAVSLAGVLRSPFFSLADETLFWLGQHPLGLAGGFAAKLDIPDAEEASKTQFARDTLGELRRLKDQLPVAELLELALDMTAFDAAMVAEFMGPRKLANLNKLIDQARAFDRSGIFALADFIEQLSRSVAEEPREPFAPIHPEKSDVVRLMTIHLSKGLEFPIVAVPDLDGGMQGDRSSFRFTPELGPMLRVPGAAGEDSESGGLALYKLMLDEEEEAESRRLLYVATTRAADYLILSSSVKKLGEPRGQWTQLLARHFELLTGKVTTQLPSDYQTPQVCVTTQQPQLPEKKQGHKPPQDLTRLAEALEQPLPALPLPLLPLVDNVPVDFTARRQFSFSQLTGLIEEETSPTDAPPAMHFLPAPGAEDPLQFGTLVHAVLGSFDFSQARSGIDVPAAVARHAARQNVFGDAAIADAVDLIAAFLASPRAATLGEAKQSYVELEFLVAWPPGTTDSNAPILHGYIDRLWQDPAGKWHVLDFKTNRVTPDNAASLAKKYARQMFLYSVAVEQIFGQAPEAAMLHFLRGGFEHSFTWSPTERDKLIAEIDQAITAARQIK